MVRFKNDNKMASLISSEKYTQKIRILSTVVAISSLSIINTVNHYGVKKSAAF